MLGSNGSGDPVVAAHDGTIAYLNHDDGFTPRYINKDVATFAESLLAYRSLIAEAQRINGPDAFLDGNVPPHLLGGFEAFLADCDPRAIGAGAMWREELICSR